MPCAAAISEHPLPTHAVGEVVGQVLEALGDRPDVALAFATGPYAGAMEDIAATVRATLRPRALIGAAAAAVVGGGREVEATRRRVRRLLRVGALPEPGQGWRAIPWPPF